MSNIFAENNSSNFEYTEENSLTSDKLIYMSQEEINQFYEAALEANTNLAIGLIRIISKTEFLKVIFHKNCPYI
ncbi:hypothetical protein LC653_22140 [Nostoc sp. CHAB 5784]|uniref:hypothetical protein n=1 Tax=Nostoc mirabile TaxID=2907820 RepID=UPI001E334008|nr:hypothetical protein [Nostoc mirabile]MCC5666537.1 hypothetical protein [Nostoc mirabile CHAB5784]